MKTQRFIYRSCLLFFLAFCLFSVPLTGFGQGLGLIYTPTGSTVNLPGEVEDIQTVESASHICTVARVFDPVTGSNYLLVRNRGRFTGTDTLNRINLGQQFGQENIFLSVVLSHDEATAVIATSQTIQREGITLLKCDMTDGSIVAEGRISWSPNLIQNFNGVQIKRRFTNAGGAADYLLAVGGDGSTNQVIVVTRVFETMTTLFSTLGNVDADLRSADSNDQFLIMVGNTNNTPNQITVSRFNANTNNFDFIQNYVSIGLNFGAPSIAYNLNPSTGNRHGYFVAVDERINASTNRPLVFRARNNGSIFWSRALENDTDVKGIFGDNFDCEVLTTVPTPFSTDFEFKKYVIDGQTGNLVAGSSTTAKISAHFSNHIKLQKAHDGRAMIVSAGNSLVANWVLYKEGNFLATGFRCDTDAQFVIAGRTVSTANNDVSAFFIFPGSSDPELTLSPETTISVNCDAPSSKTGEEATQQPPVDFRSTLFPNPVSSGDAFAHLNVNTRQEMAVELVVSDVLGRVHLKREVSLMNGETGIEIETNALPQGIYFVRLFTSGEVLAQHKLIKN